MFLQFCWGQVNDQALSRGEFQDFQGETWISGQHFPWKKGVLESVHRIDFCINMRHSVDLHTIYFHEA